MVAGRQYVAGTIMCIPAFCFGTAIGWLHPARSSQMKGSVYRFVPTEMQWTWISSLMPLGAATACLPWGSLIQVYGNKRIMMAQVVPYVISCVLLMFACDIYMIYVARYLLGVCGAAVCLAVPIYNMEISDMERRGTIASLHFGSILCGVIHTQLLVYVLDLKYVNLINLALAPLCMIILLIPESPNYYILRQEFDKAQASIDWLRKDADLDEIKLSATASEMEFHETCCQTWDHRRTKRAVFRTATLFVLLQFTGGFVLVDYFQDVFVRLLLEGYEYAFVSALSSMPIGYIICFILMDRLGRRAMLIISTVIMIISSLYLVIWFKWMQDVKWQWQPLVALCLFVFGYSVGYGPIPWIVNVELIVEPCRPHGCAIGAAIGCLTGFVVNKWCILIFYHYTLFYILVIGSMMSFIFIITLLPETKGRSTPSIQRRLQTTHQTFRSSVESF